MSFMDKDALTSLVYFAIVSFLKHTIFFAWKVNTTNYLII